VRDRARAQAASVARLAFPILKGNLPGGVARPVLCARRRARGTRLIASETFLWTVALFASKASPPDIYAKKTKKAPACSVSNFLKRKERFGRTHNLVGTAD